MHYPRLFVSGMLMLTLMLAGCSKPETPQEVAEAFWQAVAENNAKAVAEYSTLIDSAAFERFADELQQGTSPYWGRVVIDDNEASIVTRLPGEGDAADEREVLTYLVRQDGQWRVDYQRTSDAVTTRSRLKNLIGQIGDWKDRITAQFNDSSIELADRMEQLEKDLETYSAQARNQASQAMEKYGEVLRDYMEQLADSIEQALKERKQAPPGDRETLQRTMADLNDRSEELEEPTLDALARGSRTLAEAQANLSEVSSEAFADYQRQWRKMMDDIQERTERFLGELDVARR